MGVAFTACSDDKDPEYIAGAGSTGVYFASTEAATIELNKLGGATSFDIMVYRNGITDAATYPLQFTTTSDIAGLFTFPASVSFAQGASQASVTIACDVEEMAYDSRYSISVSFGEGAPVYLYGRDVYQFTLSVPAAWSDWASFEGGDCNWYYDLGFAFAGDDPGLPFLARQSLTDPNLMEFQIEHWGNDIPLYMYYDKSTKFITIPPQYTGVPDLDGKGNAMYICDLHTYCDEFLGGQYYTVWEDLIQYASYYDDETGMIYANVVYFCNPGTDLTEETNVLYNGSFGFETCQISGFPDYACSMTYKGLFIDADSDDSYAVFNTVLGNDITEGKILVSKEDDADTLLEMLKNGQGNATSVSKGNNTVNVRLLGSGEYTAVFAAFSGNEIVSSAMETFVAGGGAVSEHDWKPYGTGLIIDGWFTAAWTFTDANGNPANHDDIYWPFDVEYDAAHKGIYRLVNVWGSEDAPVNFLELNDCTKKRNIIIDASNKECVIWTPQLSGFSNAGFPAPLAGVELYCGNLGGYYAATEDATAEDLIAANITCPIEDDIFEVLPCLFGESIANCQLNWTSEPYGMIALRLPEDNGVIGKYKSIRNLKDKYTVGRMMRQLKHAPQAAEKLYLRVRDNSLSGEVSKVTPKTLL